MKKMWKAKWIAALTSGEYTQGKGALRTVYQDHSKYCCLGVLCNLVDSTKWKNVNKLVYGRPIDYTYNKQVGKLSNNMLDDLNISKGSMEYLIVMNDSIRGKDFVTIAKWIKENL